MGLSLGIWPVKINIIRITPLSQFVAMLGRKAMTPKSHATHAVQLLQQRQMASVTVEALVAQPGSVWFGAQLSAAPQTCRWHPCLLAPL